jgi:outer membrane protein
VLRQEQNFTSSKLSYGNQLNNNRGSFYGFSLQVPLFNNFRVRNQVKIASLGLKNSTLENANIKRVLRQNIDQAHLNMTSTFERYKALQEQLENYEISFKAAEIRFNNGVINSPEYLLVKNSYDRSKVNSITAMYEYILRIKILDFYQAKLLW